MQNSSDEAPVERPDREAGDQSDPTEAVHAFDQTNDLAPGVEGDDGGADDPDTQNNDGSVVQDIADQIGFAKPQNEDDDDGRSRYSEEGAE